jgi:hypothetical protein
MIVEIIVIAVLLFSAIQLFCKIMYVHVKDWEIFHDFTFFLRRIEVYERILLYETYHCVLVLLYSSIFLTYSLIYSIFLIICWVKYPRSLLWCLHNIVEHLYKFALCISVCPHAWNSPRTGGWIFMKFHTGELYEKVSGHFSFSLHQTILITALHGEKYIFFCVTAFGIIKEIKHWTYILNSHKISSLTWIMGLCCIYIFEC